MTPQAPAPRSLSSYRPQHDEDCQAILVTLVGEYTTTTAVGNCTCGLDLALQREAHPPQEPSPGAASHAETAQDAEEKVYHAYEAGRRLRLKYIVDHADFDVVLTGLHAARRFIFNSYNSLPAQNEQNWAAQVGSVSVSDSEASGPNGGAGAQRHNPDPTPPAGSSAVEAATAADERAWADRLEQLEFDGTWRLVKAGEVAPLTGGHGSWVETNHPAVVACMGSALACAKQGCQYDRVRQELQQEIARHIECGIELQTVADARLKDYLEALKLLSAAERERDDQREHIERLQKELDATEDRLGTLERERDALRAQIEQVIADAFHESYDPQIIMTEVRDRVRALLQPSSPPDTP